MSEKKAWTQTPLIRFLGGQNLIFTLLSLLLMSLLVLIVSSIPFIFRPFLTMFSAIATPLLLAVVFYYMFVPMVDWLEKHNISRLLGAIISIVILLSLMTLGVGIAIPIIIEQIVKFANSLPYVVNNFVNLLEQYSASHEFQTYYTQIVSWVNSSLSTIVNQIGTTLGSTLQGITNILSTLSNVFIAIMTFPMILFFLLTDGHKFKKSFLTVLPNNTRTDVNTILRQINSKVGGYIKGRLIVSSLIGVYFFIVYSLLDIDFAFVLALLAGLLSLIPYIGAIIALIPVLIIVIPISPVTTLLVLIFWALGQVLDGNILGPFIIGRNLEMHPLTILIILLGSGAVFGIIGMLLGIPVFAVLKYIFIFIFEKVKKRYETHFGIPYDEPK